MIVLESLEHAQARGARVYARVLACANAFEPSHGTNGRRGDAIRRAIGRAQCNDAYWHGMFGGLYLPHLRDALYRHLIRAEEAADAALSKSGGDYLHIEVADLDGDLLNEAMVSNGRCAVLADPAEGHRCAPPAPELLMPLAFPHTQHDRRFESNRFVYPVLSRRAQGLSIGINLNPDRVCNFGCVYCQVDRTGARETLFVDTVTLLTELEHMLPWAASGAIFEHPKFRATPPALRRLQDIAFSGDGEPTTYRGFGEAVAMNRPSAEKRTVLAFVSSFIGICIGLITSSTRPPIRS